MEYRVHRGEADVFVHAAVTGDVVGVEQFVVVGEIVAEAVGRLGVAGDGVGVGLEHAGRIDDRHGVVVDVDQELVPGAHGVGEVDRGGPIALHQRGAVIGGAENPIGAGRLHHDLREAMRATDVVAVGIGRQQRNVV